MSRRHPSYQNRRQYHLALSFADRISSIPPKDLAEAFSNFPTLQTPWAQLVRAVLLATDAQAEKRTVEFISLLKQRFIEEEVQDFLFYEIRILLEAIKKNPKELLQVINLKKEKALQLLEDLSRGKNFEQYLPVIEGIMEHFNLSQEEFPQRFLCSAKGLNWFLYKYPNNWENEKIVSLVKSVTNTESSKESFLLFQNLLTTPALKVKESYNNSLINNLPDDVKLEEILQTDKVLEIFGFTNKLLKREVYRLVRTKTPSGFFLWDFSIVASVKSLLENIPGITQESLAVGIQKILSEAPSWESSYLIEQFLYVNKFKSQTSNLSLDASPYFKGLMKHWDLLKDTVEMLAKVEAGMVFDTEGRSGKDFLLAKVKEEKLYTFKKLHDYLPRMLTSEENRTFHQKITLPTYKVLGYSVEFPINSKALEEAGKKLKICIGNGLYADRVHRGETAILFLKKKGEVVYCVEVRNQKIYQFKGYQNHEAPQRLVKRLGLLIEGKHVDSLWVKALKKLKVIPQ